jgi:subtilisin family serine protease
LYAVKALDKNGNGFVSDIVEGIDWFIRNRIQGRRAKKLKGYGIRSQGAGLMQLDNIFKA